MLNSFCCINKFRNRVRSPSADHQNENLLNVKSILHTSIYDTSKWSSLNTEKLALVLCELWHHFWSYCKNKFSKKIPLPDHSTLSPITFGDRGHAPIADHFLIFMQDIIWHRELFYMAQYASEDCLYTWYKYGTHAVLISWLDQRMSCLEHFVARLLFLLLRVLHFWG